MRHDQINPHHVLFALAMICMLLALGCILFPVYILPYLIFELHYDVPEYIIAVHVYMTEHHALSNVWIILLVTGPFFMAGIGFGYLAKMASLYVEEEVPEHEYPEVESERDKTMKQDRTWAKRELTTKIVLIMVLMLVGLFLVEYLVNVDMLSHR